MSSLETKTAAFLQIRDIVTDFGGHKAVNRGSIDMAECGSFALPGPSAGGKTRPLRSPRGSAPPPRGCESCPFLFLTL